MPVLSVASFGAACLAGATCLSAQITTLIVEGDTAPTSPPAPYETIDRPNISEGGHVLFVADTSEASVFDDGVFIDNSLVAQENDLDPAGFGLFSAFEFLETGQQINIAGRCVFIATLRETGGFGNREVIRLGTTGMLESVALEDDPAPQISGRTYRDFGFAGIFDDEGVGFMATLDNSDTSTDSVIYRAGVPLYREGDAVPGMPGLIWDGNFDEVQWNGAGDVLFEGNTSDVTGRDMVLFRNVGGVEEIVAQEEMFVDARAGLDFLELILQTALAENGAWAFRGNLGVAPSASDAVVMSEEGFYAQQGDAVPEVAGAVLGNFNGIDRNSHGDVLYLADIEGAADPLIDEGLFLNGELLVGTGLSYPELPFPLSDIGFEDVYINDARQVVFQANSGGFDGLYLIELSTGCPCDVAEPLGEGDVLDLLTYLDGWFVQDPAAEFTGDEPPLVDVLDLLAFLDCWFEFSASQSCE